MADSSTGFVDLSGCSVEAYLPGFSSTSMPLTRRSLFEKPDIGTIVLRRRAKAGEPTVSANSLYGPPEARKALKEAEKHLVKGRRDVEKASAALEKAVGLYPKFAVAWHRLGEVRAMKADPEGAREAFLRAAEADPKYVLPCLALALIELGRQNVREAAEYARRVLAAEPELPEAHFYNAVAHFTLGNFDQAEASIRVVEESPEAGRYPRTHFLLGNILIRRGAIAQAAVEFRRYVELEPFSRAAAEARKQLADWQAEGVLR